MSTYKIIGCIVLSTSLSLIAEQYRPTIFEYICSSSLAPQISGYIKHESFFDSRQVVAYGDGESLLWPENKLPDACCTDINAQSQFNMVPIETVVSCRWCGPMVGGATSSAFIEGDFFGPFDPFALVSIVNLVQLRHTFLQLNWKHVKLLAGNSFHPLVVLDCYPNTISNNDGTPFDPYSLCPQLRLTYQKGKFSFMGTACMQLNYPNTGPQGLNTTYIRDALIPNIHTQGWFKSETCIVGGAVDYKLLKPQLETATGYKTGTTIGSWATMLYCGLKFGSFTFNTKIIYGQNMTDLSMIGGYAVHTTAPVTDTQHYTTLNVISWWADISKSVHAFEPGLFLGMCKNLGSQKTIDPTNPATIYAFGENIDTILRISPRLRWSCSDSVVVGCEAEYTSAAYGTIQKDGTVTNTNTVGNIRLLAALYYNF